MAKNTPTPRRRSPAKSSKAAAAPKTRPSSNRGEAYPVVLRTREVTITIPVEDRRLYPIAVTWNRLLASDRSAQSNQPSDLRAWQETGHEAIVDLARLGNVSESEVIRFIESAARCGEVQVELEWEAENVGWAARVFPWEALIALATKPLRDRPGIEGQRIVVVRRLLCPTPRAASAGGAFCFAVSAGARQCNYDTSTERAAIEAAIEPQKLIDLTADTIDQLKAGIARFVPRVLHYVTPSVNNPDGDERRDPRLEGVSLEELAATLSASRPDLVAFSSCFTGRRLAPLAIANGAHLAVGFHDTVMDSSCPVFFGGFYREWAHTGNVLEALRNGINAHNWQKHPSDLGGVTIWADHDLITPPRGRRKSTSGTTSIGTGTGDGRLIKPEVIIAALKVTCELEKSLNYSMLHNQRGGLFTAFSVLKLQPGKLDTLEITVKIDTGFERTVESHFFCDLPEEPDRTVDFLERVTVPLGSELLRRRGEMLRGTVEVLIQCGIVRVFHSFGTIELPPCDEWKDDEEGRRFLPSFIFPRDPAVRTILTTAQPLLYALKDDFCAAFDGYPETSGADAIPAANTVDPLTAQLRSIWGALQQSCRLDYSNPPPSYSRSVQRVRTPEEVMRSRRATCLELALFLAGCWEHIGLYPVVFLSRNHAFTGYWKSISAWTSFFDTRNRINSAKAANPAAEEVVDKTLQSIDPNKASGGGISTKSSDWLLRATHHFALISREIKEERLVAVEATAVTKLAPFGEAIRLGRERLAEALSAGTFDGMIDVRTARDQRVTPLAIMTQGVVA